MLLLLLMDRILQSKLVYLLNQLIDLFRTFMSFLLISKRKSSGLLWVMQLSTLRVVDLPILHWRRNASLLEIIEHVVSLIGDRLELLHPPLDIVVCLAPLLGVDQLALNG